MTTGYSSLLVEVAWNQDPISSATLTWTNMTAAVQQIGINRGRDEQWEPHAPGTATVKFNSSKDSRLQADGDLTPHTPVRISVNNAASARKYLFTGFVQSRGGASFAYENTVETVTVSCYDALGVLATRTLEPFPDDSSTYSIYVSIVHKLRGDELGPATKFGGQLSGDVINSIVAAYTANAPVFPLWQTEVIDFGNTIFQDVAMGVNALDLFHNIAMSEGGAFYVLGDGSIKFDQRFAPVSAPTQDASLITFDEAGVAGPSFGTDFTVWQPTVYTSASTQLANSDQVATFEEAASLAAYGAAAYPQITGALVASTTEAQALSERIVRTSDSVVGCPKTIRLFPRRDNTTLNAVAGRELRDHCTFKSSVAHMGSGTEVTVERIQHSIDVASKSWTCDLSFSSRAQLFANYGDLPPWLILDDATNGKLDGTRELAW